MNILYNIENIYQFNCIIGHYTIVTQQLTQGKAYNSQFDEIRVFHHVIYIYTSIYFFYRILLIISLILAVSKYDTNTIF